MPATGEGGRARDVLSAAEDVRGSGGGLVEWMESMRVQVVAVACAVLLVGGWHWQNDGLWFQGDAPRHAATGLFFWDALTTLPADPLSYALSYYARYPVLILGAYPPLFHIVEGGAFGLFGPSPYVAKALVLTCAGLAGAYTMQWGRRWIAPLAGWAGACVALLPAFIRYSNAVLLNVPATAFGLAALYHFHAWLDGAQARDRTRFIWFTVATTLIYYPGAIVLPVAMAWMLCSKQRARARFLWILGALLAVAVLVLAAVFPAQLARQVPSMARLTSPINWVFYASRLVGLTGASWAVLALCGAVAGLARPARRPETVRLVLAFATTLVCLSLLPARDERYALLLGPIVVLTAFVAIAAAAEAAPRWKGRAAAATVGVMLVLSTQAALGTPVKDVAGIDAVARYLRDNAPRDAVLYSGMYDGVFGFYVRALDPGFERRVVLSGRLLYQYRQRVDFTWVETPYVTSPADVVSLMQTTSGCRWVAVEVGGEASLAASEHVLRQALQGPAFERVQSFPVAGRPVHRIDLYRFTERLDPVPAMDLMFPSFSARVFRGVAPIAGNR